MNDSSSSSTGCARIRSDWKAAMPHRTLTATRSRNDARRDGLNCAVADAAPGRLPRNQPRDGVALRGGAGDAGAEGECSDEGIALGHALSIGCVVLAAAFLGMALPQEEIRYPVAGLLFGLGILSLVGHHHPRWVRMQVGFRDLTVWSFLMASAHGAGLMVVPVLLGSSMVEARGSMADHNHMASSVTPLAGILATGVHTFAYLAVTGLVAWLVYRKFGLALLRKTWFNFDLLWAVALVATGLVTLLV